MEDSKATDMKDGAHSNSIGFDTLSNLGGSLRCSASKVESGGKSCNPSSCSGGYGIVHHDIGGKVLLPLLLMWATLGSYLLSPQEFV